MAVYYSIKCPNCNNTVESGKDRTTQYGSPFRKCRYCGHTYVDINYVEPGVLPESVLYRRQFSWGGLIIALVGLMFIYAAFDYGAFGGESILMGALGVGIIIFGMASIISTWKYDPKQDSTLARQVKESKERLSNPHYVFALYRVGCCSNLELLEWANKAIMQESEKQMYNNTKPIRFCMNCGQAVELDCNFCQKCGTKIEKETYKGI